MKSLLDLFRSSPNVAFFEELFGDVFIEDGYIVCADGTLTAGFLIDLPKSESLGEESLTAFIEQLTKILNRLPANSTVHFQQHYFTKPSTLEVEGGFLTKKLAQHLGDRPVLHLRTVLYLCFSPGQAVQYTPANTLLPGLKFQRNPVIKNIDAQKAACRGVIQNFIVQLNSLPGVRVGQMTTEGLKQERKRYFNLEFGSKTSPIKGDVENKGSSVVVGNKNLTTLHLKEPGKLLYYSIPNEKGVSTCMAWPLGMALPFPHIINLTLCLHDSEKILETLDTTRKRSRNLGSLQKQADRIIESDIEAFTLAARQQGDRLCLMNHNVMVYDVDPDRLAYKIDQVYTAYTRMNGSYALVDPFNAANNFITYSPGFAYQSFDTLVMSVEDALLHFQFTQPDPGDQQGFLVSTRDGEPYLLDLWHDSLPNKNIIAIGPTGSGKSFFFNFFLSQTIEQRYEVVILDVGGSYKNLFQFHQHSVYKEYGKNTTFSFNPFLIPTDAAGRYILSQDKIVFLLSVITLLWKDVKVNELLSREEESILTEILTAYYENVNANQLLPRLDHFVEYIQQLVSEVKLNPTSHAGIAENLKYFSHESFIVSMSLFTRGYYKTALNSDTNENISLNRLVCFDLQGLQSDPILYPVISLLIIELILDKIRENPKVRKQIVIDEAWSMLKGTIGGFIENLFRTVRKAGGSVCIITQSIVELKDSKIGEALKANAAIKILLDHTSQVAQLPDLQRFFALTDHDLELLRSIRSTDTWREVYVMRNDQSQVVRIEAGPHNTIAFSSKREDRADVTSLIEKAGPEYAINQLASIQPNPMPS